MVGSLFHAFGQSRFKNGLKILLSLIQWGTKSQKHVKVHMSSNASWLCLDVYFNQLANPDLTQTPQVIYSKIHQKFYSSKMKILLFSIEWRTKLQKHVKFHIALMLPGLVWKPFLFPLPIQNWFRLPKITHSKMHQKFYYFKTLQ